MDIHGLMKLCLFEGRQDGGVAEVQTNADEVQKTAHIADQLVLLNKDGETTKKAEQQRESSSDQEEADVVYICIHGQAFQCKPQVGIPIKEFKRKSVQTGSCCSCSKLHMHPDAEVHGGEINKNQKFACDECGKRFSQNTADHPVTAHTDSNESDTNTANIDTNTAQQTTKRLAHNLDPNKPQKGQGSCSMSCLECGKIFTRERALGMHMKQHDKEKLTRSKKKDDTKRSSQSDALIFLPSKFKLPQHEDHSSYCQMQLFVCEECPTPKVFNRLNQLWQHKATHEKKSCSPESKELSCRKCSKVFSRPDLLKRHELYHAKVAGKVIKCVLCLESFEDRIVYKAHEKNHLKQNQSPEMECKVCQKVLRNISALQRHTQMHNNEEQFPCRLGCNASFASSFRREKHEVGECTLGDNFLCTFCGKLFSSKSRLHVHETKHIKNPQKKEFVCQYCSRVFGFLTAFRRHERTHTNERPFKCQFCPKTFQRNCSLVCHERVHTREKPFQCEVCGRAFSQDTHRKRHMRVHTGEKPYQCRKCGKRFAHSTTLTMHEKNHDKPRKRRGRKPGTFTKKHSGENKNKCQFCGRTFNHRNNLINHERVHTKEKPYKCKVCGKAFRQGAHCRGHMRTHTGEKPYQCKICGKAFAIIGNCKAHEKIHDKTGRVPKRTPRSAAKNSEETLAQKPKNPETPEVPPVMFQEISEDGVLTQVVQGQEVTIGEEGEQHSSILQGSEHDLQGADIILQLLESGSRVANLGNLVQNLHPQ